jgi:hypothetical protein
MTTNKAILIGLLLVAILSAGQAQTGLVLSGDTIAVFRPVSTAGAAAAELPANQNVSFRIGVPEAQSFQSGAQFNHQSFINIHDGDTFSSDLITYFNGINRIGTSSGYAQLDLFLQLNGTAALIPLTTINFGIEATANSRGRLIPDTFRANFIQPKPVWIDDQWVKFSVVGLPDSFQLAENSRINLGSLTIAAIPEPQTSATLLGIAILCLAIRYRQREAGSAKSNSILRPAYADLNSRHIGKRPLRHAPRPCNPNETHNTSEAQS